MPDEIDRFLAGYPPDVRQVAQEARTLVASIAPDAEETLKLGWKVVWYGFGKKMADQFAVIMPTRNHVGLGFTHGSDLPDPRGRLEGTGKRMRHVKLRTPADVVDPAVADLLRAQVAMARPGKVAARPRPKVTAGAASPRRGATPKRRPPAPKKRPTSGRAARARS